MADPNRSASASGDDRETRIRQLMERLQPLLERRARKMAEALTDTPPEQILGPVEYTLRDHAHRLATEVHQVALDGDQKRGTTGPAESAPTAPTTPASSSTEPVPS
jgi:hypothetical protein